MIKEVEEAGEVHHTVGEDVKLQRALLDKHLLVLAQLHTR